MNWYLGLLMLTVFVRGMGAGVIYDVALVSLPLRHDIGILAYAKYARALFGRGAKTFASVSIGGALLTAGVVIGAFVVGSPSVRLWACIALGATVLAFAGTTRALPAILKLRGVGNDEHAFAALLDRFERWHTISTAWQVISFGALIVALTDYVTP